MKIVTLTDPHLEIINFLKNRKDHYSTLSTIISAIKEETDFFIGLGDYGTKDEIYKGLVGVLIKNAYEKDLILLNGNHDKKDVTINKRLIKKVYDGYQNKNFPNLDTLPEMNDSDWQKIFCGGYEFKTKSRNEENLYIFCHSLEQILNDEVEIIENMKRCYGKYYKNMLNQNDLHKERCNLFTDKNRILEKYKNEISEKTKRIIIVSGHSHDAPYAVKIDHIENENSPDIIRVRLSPYTTYDLNKKPKERIIINHSVFIIDTEESSITQVYFLNKGYPPNGIHYNFLFEIENLKEERDILKIKEEGQSTTYQMPIRKGKYLKN